MISSKNTLEMGVGSNNTDSDFEVASLHVIPGSGLNKQEFAWRNLKYTIAGILFGIISVKSEIISWFRIQEMFRLQSFHMYGVMGTAVVVGMISVWAIKKLGIKDINGDPIVFYPKKFDKGKIFGGIIFGFGWALTGACPGPLFALVGTGSFVVIVVIIFAVMGTWVYGYLQEKLPH